MMTAVFTKVVTSTINVVARKSFPVIACCLSFMTLVVVVTEDTLIASRISNNITTIITTAVITLILIISIYHTSE